MGGRRKSRIAAATSRGRRMKKPEDSQPKRPQRNKKGEEERRNGRPAQAPNRPVSGGIECQGRTLQGGAESRAEWPGVYTSIATQAPQRATKWSGQGGDRRPAQAPDSRRRVKKEDEKSGRPPAQAPSKKKQRKAKMGGPARRRIAAQYKRDARTEEPGRQGEFLQGGWGVGRVRTGQEAL